MRDYGKVTPTFWTGATGRQLRGNPDAQVLALYLFTCPASTMSGVFHLSLPTSAYETGLGEAEVRRAFVALQDLDVAHYDEAEELVWVVNMIRHQVADQLAEGDKRRTGIQRELLPYRGHPFVRALVERYGLPAMLAEGPSGRFPADVKKALPGIVYQDNHVATPLPKGLRMPISGSGSGSGADQDQTGSEEPVGARARDPGLAPGGALALVPAAGGGAAEQTTAAKLAEVAAHYRTYHPRAHPGGIRKSSLEAKRLIARFKDGYTVEQINRAIDGYHHDPWYLGANDRNTPYLSLELLVRDSAHVEKGIALQQRGAPPVLSDREKQSLLATQRFLAKSAEENHDGTRETDLGR